MVDVASVVVAAVVVVDGATTSTTDGFRCLLLIRKYATDAQ